MWTNSQKEPDNDLHHFTKGLTMAGTTYSKFFWQDFQADDELRLVSLGAQGLWMRLLCMAARANPTGHVLVSGKDPAPSDVRRITGCSETDAQILAFRRELIEAQVCDVTASGVLVSRRLVRDAKRRKISEKGGKARQAQRLEVPEKNDVGMRRVVQPSASATINHQPESINHQPSTTPPAGTSEGDVLAKNTSKVDRVAGALGVSLNSLVRQGAGGYAWVQQIIEFEKTGADFELDILPAIQAGAKAWRAKRTSDALRFFSKSIAESFEGRTMGAKMELARQQNRNNTPFEDTDAKGWNFRLRVWLLSGYWPFSHGPRPRSGQCRAPAEMLAEGLKLWEKQGGHPQEAFEDVDNSLSKRWNLLRSVRPSPDVDYGDGPLPGSNVVPISARASSA